MTAMQNGWMDQMVLKLVYSKTFGYFSATAYDYFNPYVYTNNLEKNVK
jgi:hypothetical protein